MPSKVCYICLEPAGNRFVRDCACKGAGGAVHLSCLVTQAYVQASSYTGEATFDPLHFKGMVCDICRCSRHPRVRRTIAAACCRDKRTKMEPLFAVLSAWQHGVELKSSGYTSRALKEFCSVALAVSGNFELCLRTARALADRSAEVARVVDLVRPDSKFVSMLLRRLEAEILHWTGRTREAVNVLESVEFANPLNETRTLLRAAEFWVDRGQYSTAIDFYNRAMSLCAENDSGFSQVYFAVHIARLLVVLGEVRYAAGVLMSSVRAGDVTGDGLWVLHELVDVLCHFDLEAAWVQSQILAERAAALEDSDYKVDVLTTQMLVCSLRVDTANLHTCQQTLRALLQKECLCNDK